MGVQCRRGFYGLLLGALAALVSPACAAAASYGYVRGHNCPRCGRVVTAVHSFRPDGRHYHRCGATYWYH